jgi:hypothetical protein
MSIYNSALRKYAAYDAQQAMTDYNPETAPFIEALNDPNLSTAERLEIAVELAKLGDYKNIPVKNILRGGWEDIKSGATKDINDLKTRLLKKYTVAKNDAKARYNKFKADLPGMYAEGKKQLGDFYDANKGAVWAGGLGAVGGGTIGAALAKNRVLGGLVGAGVGTGVGLGAYRIAKYLGYDI